MAMQPPRIPQASAYIVGGALSAMALGILVPFFFSVIAPYLATNQ